MPRTPLSHPLPQTGQRRPILATVLLALAAVGSAQALHAHHEPEPRGPAGATAAASPAGPSGTGFARSDNPAAARSAADL